MDNEDYSDKVYAMRGLIFRIARRYFSNIEDREDMTQEVMERLLTKPISRENMRGLVATIAHRAMKDELRRRKCQPYREYDFDPDSLGSQHVYLVAEHIDLDRAVSRLTLRRKMSVILWAQGYSYEEIARQRVFSEIRKTQCVLWNEGTQRVSHELDSQVST